MERAHGQNLIAQRDKAVSEALERVEVASKELAEALKAVSTAETRAQVAEVILFAWIVITHWLGILSFSQYSSMVYVKIVNFFAHYYSDDV